MAETELGVSLDATGGRNFAPQLAMEAPLRPAARKCSFRRSIFEFFNAGPGSRIAALAVDLHFLAWRLANPGAQFSDYYAGSIAAALKRGGTHKTLGGKRFLSSSGKSVPDTIAPHLFQSRGLNYFAAAVRHGLLPEHTCIDFGCGSLRVGQHLMAHLAPGRYWGLDLVSDFFEAGLPLLPAGLAAQKRPHMHVIGDETLSLARQAKPDFVVCFAVLKHVPPSELNAFFTSILRLTAAHTKVLITFNEGERTSRTGAKIWDYCRDEVAASVQSRCADARCTFTPLDEMTDGDRLPRTSILFIQRSERFSKVLSGSWGAC